MKTLPSIKKVKFQNGSTLIEALVSILLVGIMSAGTIGISSRVALIQATGAQQQIAINKLSDVLRSGVSLCNGANPKNNVNAPVIPNIEAGDLRLQISGCEATTATLAGTDIKSARKNVVLTLQRRVGKDTFTDFVKVGS